MGAHGEAIGQVGVRYRATVHGLDLDPTLDAFESRARVRHVHQGRGSVVADVEIEKTVPVNIGQRDRHPALADVQRLLHRGETALALVEEEPRAVAERVDDQVEVAVAVQIGEGGARRGQTRRSDASPASDVLEPPVSPVAVEGVRAGQVAEVQVAPAVAIHVASASPAPLSRT